MVRISYFVLSVITVVVLSSAYYVQTITFSKAKDRDSAYRALSNINKSYNELQYVLLRCVAYADVEKDQLEQSVENFRQSSAQLQNISTTIVDIETVLDELNTVIVKVDTLSCIQTQTIVGNEKDFNYLQSIFSSNLITMLETIKFNYETNQNIQREQVFSYIKLLISLFLIFIALVTYFVYYNSKEKNKLNRLQKSLEASLVTDNLTRLGNRNAITKNLRKIKENLSVVMFNIVKFKHINDFYGVNVGDYVLKSVAMKLRKITKKYADVELYRVGGDDFVVVCKNGDINMILSMTKEIMKYYESNGIEYSDTVIDIALVAGITQTNPYLETVDLALKEAKKNKNSALVVYSDELDNTKIIEENFNALKMLKEGIANDRFFPQFQPIVDLKTGQVNKYEALIRLKKEDGTIAYPRSFIEEAKESKLLNKLTKIMLIKSFEVFKHVDCSFSINLSFSEIIDEKNQDEIIKILDDYGRHAKKLTFEILEDEAIDDYQLLDRFLSKVQKFGVDIAIDDFGSGYSNFDHIISLNTHFLKIDGSLIKIIDYDVQARVLVKSIVDFAKSMRIKTVAEFVHSQDVLDMAKRLGIDYVQGFHLGKPTNGLENLESGYKV